jgi:cellobiose phosphorylase
MAKTTIVVLLVCFSISLMAQTADQNQSSAANQHQSKKAKDEITARGCVTKQSTDYLLVQAEEGNSYELQGSKKLKLRLYLGQEVEVTGVESATLGTSSDYLARSGVASPVTITVRSIKTIQKRCSGN